MNFDLTRPDQILAAASEVHTLDLLINNAGILHSFDLLTDDLQQVRDESEVNFIGALRVTRAFLQQLEAAEGGRSSQCSDARCARQPRHDGRCIVDAASTRAGFSSVAATHAEEEELGCHGSRVDRLFRSARCGLAGNALRMLNFWARPGDSHYRPRRMAMARKLRELQPLREGQD